MFEEVSNEVVKGQVLKPLERGTAARHQNDPLPGRIRYRDSDHSEVEVPFGDKDQKGDFTLRYSIFKIMEMYKVGRTSESKHSMKYFSSLLIIRGWFDK